MNEVLLVKYDYAWQADALVEKLNDANIKSTVISRPREYSVLVTGGPIDPADVYVNENNLTQAKQILNDHITSNASSEVTEKYENNYFKKVIVFSFLSFMFLPLVFNYVATINFLKFCKEPASFSKKIFALFVLIFSWIVAIAISAILANEGFKLFTH